MVIGILVIAAAGFIQGLTSFGFALASIPFLSVVFPLKEAVPIIVFLCLCTNFQISVNCYKEVKIKKIWLLVVFSLVFAPVGVYSLKYLNPAYLKLFAGIIILAFSILLLLKKTFPLKNEKIGFMTAGSLSGFLNGSVSLSGPPVAIFLSNQGTNKDEFRANMTVSALILNIMTTGTYFAGGLLNTAILGKALYLVPAMLAGVFFGIKCSKRIDEKIFKTVILVLLMVSAVWTIINWRQ